MGKYDWVVMPDEKKTTLLQTIPTTPSQAKAGKYDWIPTKTDVKTPETALGFEGEKRKIESTIYTPPELPKAPQTGFEKLQRGLLYETNVGAGIVTSFLNRSDVKIEIANAVRENKTGKEVKELLYKKIRESDLSEEQKDFLAPRLSPIEQGVENFLTDIGISLSTYLPFGL